MRGALERDRYGDFEPAEKVRNVFEGEMIGFAEAEGLVFGKAARGFEAEGECPDSVLRGKPVVEFLEKGRRALSGFMGKTRE
jgi:hypothetical protein